MKIIHLAEANLAKGLGRKKSEHFIILPLQTEKQFIKRREACLFRHFRLSSLLLFERKTTY